MIVGGNQQPMFGHGPSPKSLWLEFDVNGTSDPSSTTFIGSLAQFVSTITYASTGKYVITFKTGFVPPAKKYSFFISETCADQTTNAFKAIQIGAYDETNRQLTVGAVKPNTSVFQAVAPSAPSGARGASIKVVVDVNDSGGG